MIHLNKIKTLDLTYLDKRSRETLEITQDEVMFRGSQVVRDVVKPESLEYAKNLFGNYEFDDPSRVYHIFKP